MPDAAPDPGGDGMTSVEIDIEGMSCGACVTAVKNALGRLAGVTSYETEVGFTRVQFQSGTITTAAIVEGAEVPSFLRWKAFIVEPGLRFFVPYYDISRPLTTDCSTLQPSRTAALTRVFGSRSLRLSSSL